MTDLPGVKSMEKPKNRTKNEFGEGAKLNPQPKEENPSMTSPASQAHIKAGSAPAVW